MVLALLPFGVFPAGAAVTPGHARIVLTAGDSWGDGTGYQMLLDATATAYGGTIPDSGPLTRGGDVPDAIYNTFAYKIPTNADGALATQNIVLNDSVSIEIPAGTYDYCITNPTPTGGGTIGPTMWIASGAASRGNDFVFEAGTIYCFDVTRDGDSDLVTLTVKVAAAPESVTNFQAAPVGQTLDCDLSWTNPSLDRDGDPLAELTAVKVERNGVLIHTSVSPVIGGAETFTDTVPADGTYAYTVYGVNSAATGVVTTQTLLVGRVPHTIPVDSFPWTEGFEDANSLDNWDKEYVSGSLDWKLVGSNGSSPATPHGGSSFALFKSSVRGSTTKLISRPLKLSGLTTPALTFWHTQKEWMSDQDVLRVYYKTSAAGPWTLLKTYESSISEWTKEVLLLPNKSDDYYIAFEGTNEYGWGIALDDISVMDAASYKDIEVLSIDQPASGANLTSAETVQITLKNNGFDSVSNVSVKLEVDGAEITTETITESIPTLDTHTYTFSGKVDLSGVDEYTITVTATLAGDADPTNNIVNKQVRNYGNVAVMGVSSPVTVGHAAMQFFDDGEDGNYIFTQSETQVMTVLPETAGDAVTVTFTEFSAAVDSYYGTYDALFVVSGTVVDPDDVNRDDILATLNGDMTQQLPLEFTSESSDGALTFIFKKQNDLGLTESGWVAEVVSVTPPAKDAGVTEILSALATDSDTFAVKARIKNFGSDPLTAMDLCYQVDSETPVTMQWTGNLSYMQTAEVTFSVPVTLPAEGDYTLKVYTDLSGDEKTSNDSLTKTICYDKTRLYGFRIFGGAEEFVSFLPGAPGVLNSEKAFADGSNTVSAGEYVDGRLYLVTYNYTTAAPENFITLSDSFETLSSTATNERANDMTYDYSTETMYAVDSTNLYTVNLETGQLAVIAPTSKVFITLACDLSGTLYGITKTDGGLYTINKTTGAATLVGNTGYHPNFLQSMAFDHNSGRLFWAYMNAATSSKLLEVNPATGSCTDLGYLGSGNTTIVALHTPYTNPTHAVTYSVVGGTGGTLSAKANGSPLSSGGTAREGKDIVFTATPDAGYRVKGWTDNTAAVNGTNGTYTISGITEAHTVTAEFELIPTHAVTVTGGTGGGTYAEGATVVVSADAPGANEKFKEWTAVGVTLTDPQAASVSFTMPTNAVELTATYEALPPGYYSITVKTDGNGTANADAHSAQENDPITLTVAPNSGYRFKEWQATAGGVTVTNNAFTMPAANVVLTAIFEKTEYTVTVAGSYAGTTGEGTYTIGNPVSIDAGSRSGYTFTGWTAAGVTLSSPSSAQTSFTMPANGVTVTANWRRNSANNLPISGSSSAKSTVTTTTDLNGTVAVSPANPSSGQTVAVIPKPNEGYEVDTITVKDANGKVLETTKREDGTYTFTYGGVAVTVTATFKKSAEGGWKNPYSDVKETDWFYEAVRFVVENDLFKGLSETEFGPGETMTRGMLVTVLGRLAKVDATTGQTPFDDVDEDAYYAEYVAWATKNGIVFGYDETSFGPDDPITRQDVAVVLARFMEFAGINIPVTEEYRVFADEEDIEDYAKNAVQLMNKLGIINGTGENTINPKGEATRAEVAAMLQRFLEAIQ
ncbi:DUF2436 domain-containing protein [Oscillospiraceae bacterium OttesenSCG-928-G22]|nr:DUF2436 domain-containing protein [Oscillospiraceae bacterium OttesenSCG-928-G22]